MAQLARARRSVTLPVQLVLGFDSAPSGVVAETLQSPTTRTWRNGSGLW